MSTPATFNMIFTTQSGQNTSSNQTSQTSQTSQPGQILNIPSNTLAMGNMGNFRFRGNMFSSMQSAKGCKTCGGK